MPAYLSLIKVLAPVIAVGSPEKFFVCWFGYLWIEHGLHVCDISHILKLVVDGDVPYMNVWDCVTLPQVKILFHYKQK
jgi:hypothetical protein